MFQHCSPDAQEIRDSSMMSIATTSYNDYVPKNCGRWLELRTDSDEKLMFNFSWPNIILTCIILNTLQGAIQVFIQVIDHDPPFGDNNLDEIVDRFFIDRDDLELGAGFSATTLYTGSFGWGRIQLRLRVNCAEGFSGEDCNIGKTATASV